MKKKQFLRPLRIAVKNYKLRGTSVRHRKSGSFGPSKVFSREEELSASQLLGLQQPLQPLREKAGERRTTTTTAASVVLSRAKKQKPAKN